MKRNKITTVGGWPQVCSLCRDMANSLENPNPVLAYIATDSLGGRRWVAEGKAKDTRPSHNGVYLGFAEEQLSEVEFTSATSGAVIRAKKKRNGSWVFRFMGADVPQNRGCESGYATTFENLGLEVLHKSLPFEAEWAKSAHFKYHPAEPRVYA